MGKRADEIENARQALAGYDALERKNTDAAGWLMIKFGWSRRKAESVVVKVRQEDGERQEGKS